MKRVHQLKTSTQYWFSRGGQLYTTTDTQLACELAPRADSVLIIPSAHVNIKRILRIVGLCRNVLTLTYKGGYGILCMSTSKLRFECLYAATGCRLPQHLRKQMTYISPGRYAYEISGRKERWKIVSYRGGNMVRADYYDNVRARRKWPDEDAFLAAVEVRNIVLNDGLDKYMSRLPNLRKLEIRYADSMPPGWWKHLPQLKVLMAPCAVVKLRRLPPRLIHISCSRVVGSIPSQVKYLYVKDARNITLAGIHKHRPLVHKDTFRAGELKLETTGGARHIARTFHAQSCTQRHTSTHTTPAHVACTSREQSCSFSHTTHTTHTTPTTLVQLCIATMRPQDYLRAEIDEVSWERITAGMVMCPCAKLMATMIVTKHKGTMMMVCRECAPNFTPIK